MLENMEDKTRKNYDFRAAMMLMQKWDVEL